VLSGPGDFVKQSKDSEGTVQTAIRLSKAVFEALKASDAGVSGDMRRRLDYTFDLEPVDETTLALLTRIARMAEEVRLETGAAWHQHPGAHAAFRQAILSNLARLKPEGSTKFGERPNRSMAEDDPQEIGTWIEHDVWSTRDASHGERRASRIEKQATYREIARLRKQRQGDDHD
jgi:hypothetical protein